MPLDSSPLIPPLDICVVIAELCDAECLRNLALVCSTFAEACQPKIVKNYTVNVASKHALQSMQAQLRRLRKHPKLLRLVDTCRFVDYRDQNERPIPDVLAEQWARNCYHLLNDAVFLTCIVEVLNLLAVHNLASLDLDFKNFVCEWNLIPRGLRDALGMAIDTSGLRRLSLKHVGNFPLGSLSRVARNGLQVLSIDSVSLDNVSSTPRSLGTTGACLETLRLLDVSSNSKRAFISLFDAWSIHLPDGSNQLPCNQVVLGLPSFMDYTFSKEVYLRIINVTSTLVQYVEIDFSRLHLRDSMREYPHFARRFEEHLAALQMGICCLRSLKGIQFKITSFDWTDAEAALHQLYWSFAVLKDLQHTEKVRKISILVSVHSVASLMEDSGWWVLADILEDDRFSSMETLEISLKTTSADGRIGHIANSARQELSGIEAKGVRVQCTAEYARYY